VGSITVIVIYSLQNSKKLKIPYIIRITDQIIKKIQTDSPILDPLLFERNELIKNVIYEALFDGGFDILP
jgi:hypothetical protein